MKRHHELLFFVVFFYVLAGRVAGQWVQVTSNYGSDVNAFAATSTALYAGTSSGIFLSTDSGATWKRTGLGGVYVFALCATGGNVFAGTDSGAFVSADGAENWVFSGIQGVLVTAFTIHGSKVFAATRGIGVFVTTDNGSSWQPSGLSGARVEDITILGDNLFAELLGSGVYRSSDDGVTWTGVNSGLSTLYVRCLLANGTNIYAGTDDGVFKSTDQGENWNAVNSGWADISDGGSASSLVATGGSLIAGSNSNSTTHIFLSADDGASWVPTSTIVNTPNTLFVYGTRVFAGMYMAGVFCSTDEGRSWTGLGLASGASRLIADGNDLLRNYSTGGGVYISVDKGETWTAVNSGLGNTNVQALAASGDTIFAGTQGGPVGLFLSTNRGSSWNQLGLFGRSVYSLSLSGHIVMAGTDAGLYLSTDGGESWNQISDITGPIANVVTSNSLAMAASFSGGPFVSSDSGKSWSHPFIPYTGTFALGIMGTELLIGEGGLHVSNDSGVTWSGGVGDQTPSPLPYEISSFATTGTEVFAATSGHGVFGSVKPETQWKDFSAGLTDLTIESLAASNGYLFAVDDTGRIWRRPLSEMVVGVKGQKNTLPSEFALSQNYPNPFNPSTMINYQLPVSKYVTLKVYDILGREVATLVDAFKPEGSYEVIFDGSRLSSGVYFYRLTAPGINIIRKMLLEK